MNVPLKMIDRDQRLFERECQRLRITDSDQQSSRESRPLGHSQRVKGFVGERLPHHGNDRPEMLAGRKLGYHSSVGLMGGNLRGDDVRYRLLPRAHHSRGGLVTRAFDTENEGGGHVLFS